MTGYLDEMLARQALAAGEQQAAERLLARLREQEAIRKTEKEPDPEAAAPLRGQKAIRKTEKEAADEAAERLTRNKETRRTIWLPADPMTEGSAAADAVSSPDEWDKAEVHADAQLRIWQRLRILAEGGAERSATRLPAEESGVWQPLSAWSWMERRIARAIQPTIQTITPRSAPALPSNGARDITPGGTADAEALSRLYERDARRYDGCFELPL